jgi:hypothetical protein
MRRSNFALRVPPTLLAEARKAADQKAWRSINSSRLRSRKRSPPCEQKITSRNARVALMRLGSAEFSLASVREILLSRAMNFHWNLFRGR